MHADETPAAELWRRTLSQIPSLFGRLVYLSSLRDPNTGGYKHFGFSQRFGDREADRTMRRSHLNTFEDWLCFSIEQQKTDVELYLAAADFEKTAAVANWLRWPPFMNWIPVETREVQRDLFVADLRTVLELLNYDYAGVCLDRSASPPQ